MAAARVHPSPPPWTAAAAGGAAGGTAAGGAAGGTAAGGAAGGTGYVRVHPLSEWETAAGRELERTRTLLQEGTDSERRKVVVDAANAILIGASLIATVTYASWLILPYDNIVHKKAVKVFWAFNSLSFFFAVATVLLCASAAVPNINRPMNLPSMLSRLRWGSLIYTYSVYSVLGAFTSAAYIRVPYEQHKYLIDDALIIAITVVGTIVSFLGLVYFLGAFVYLPVGMRGN